MLRADPSAPYGIAIAGDRVFWTSHGTEVTDDGSLNTVSSDGGSPKSLASFLPGAAFLALDAVNKKVYFASNGSMNSGYNDGTFALVDFDGNGLRSMMGYPHASSIAIGEKVVYWTSSQLGTGTADLTLSGPSLPLFGSGAPFSIALGTNDIVTTDVGDAPTYTANGHVARNSLDGGAKPDLLTLPKRPRMVTVRHDVAYWTMEGNGTVYKHDLTGTASNVTLVTGLLSPMGIAVDDKFAYVTCQGTSTVPDAGVAPFSTDGTVVRIPLSGTCVSPACPEVLADHQGWPFGIAVDDQAVYWVNRASGEVMELRK